MSCSIENVNSKQVRYYSLSSVLYCYTDDAELRDEIRESLKNDDELVFGNSHVHAITLVRAENVAEALFTSDWDDAARYISDELGSAYIDLES